MRVLVCTFTNAELFLSQAIDASYPVLDESIAKVDLQKKMNKMERVFNNMVIFILTYAYTHSIHTYILHTYAYT
jgi:hypothetical protein